MLRRPDIRHRPRPERPDRLRVPRCPTRCAARSAVLPSQMRTCGASSVTHIAMGELAEAKAFMRRNGFALGPGVGRLPIHVGDAVVRPQMRDRIAMTIEAEFHGERL